MLKSNILFFPCDYLKATVDDYTGITVHQIMGPV